MYKTRLENIIQDGSQLTVMEHGLETIKQKQ